MEDDSRIITPNELNKFSYCPYQWYYERYYGKKGLREAAKKGGKKSAAAPSAARISHFAAGNAHHEKVYKQVKRGQTVVYFLIVLFVIFLIIFAVLMFGR